MLYLTCSAYEPLTLSLYSMVPPNLTVVQSCDRLHTIKVNLYMTFPLPYLSNTHTSCSPAFLLQLGHSCLVVVFAFFYMM